MSNRRIALPREFLPCDMEGEYPRLVGETQKDWEKRVLPGGSVAKYNEGSVESTERGSCARTNAGKVSLSLIPFHLLAGAAKVMMKGRKKYAPWNWAKGGKWSTPMDCLLRHLFKWWFCGEELDKESGEHHLDHVMCNLLFLIHYVKTYTEGDDRPEPAITHFNKELSELEKNHEN